MAARLLAPLALCLAACSEAVASTVDLPVTGPVQPIQLAPAKTLVDRSQPSEPFREPTFVEADRIDGQRNQFLEAEGSVEARNVREQINADWLRYEVAADQIDARGHIVYLRDGGRIESDRLSLKLTERIGEASPIRYSFPREGTVGRGDADVLRFQGRDRYALDDATYTTCPAGNDDWVLRMGELELDYATDLGISRHTRVEFLGTPILYSPWFDFALSEKRKSGFLPPTIGLTNERGLDMATPWYWNLAPNRDATITPRLMSKRGLQLGGEYRYLEPSYSGEINVEVLPNDKLTGDTRSHTLLRHRQQFTPQLTGSVTYENVSDDLYFTELTSLINQTSLVHLPREARLDYSGSWWNAFARLQSYQTLDDPNDPAIVEPLYRRVPQLVLNAGKPLGHADLPWRWDLNGEFVRFEHDWDSKSAGNRLHAYPSVSLPIEAEHGFFRPKLGLHYTQYSLDRNDRDASELDLTRSLPIASLDTGLFFEREYGWGQGSYVQTLEPRLYYLNIPYEDQDAIPVFDTGLADLSFAQLFSENQFVGQDRVNDANQLTLALTSRFLDNQSGLERLAVTVGQRYYFTDQRVTLPGGTPRGSDVTDLLLQASGQLTRNWRLGTYVQYNPDNADLVRANAGAHYQPAQGKVLNLDLRFINEVYTANQNEGLKQVDISWQWPLQAKWYSLGRFNYSTLDNRLVEGLLGFEYNAGCWSLRGMFQKLATTSDTTSNAFYLQLELRGLTSLGINPLGVLERSISGYSKSDEINPQ